MKTSKFLLMGTLLVALFMVMPAMAGIPNLPFTGDVEADFPDDPGILIILDPGKGNPQVPEGKDVYVGEQPPHPTDPSKPAGYNPGSGWDIKDLRLAYDAGTDTLYVGLNSWNMVGDVDGDGDPNGTTWGGGYDEDDLGGTESVAVYFDLNPDPLIPFNMADAWDVIVGVSNETDFSGFGIFTTKGSGTSPPGNFGSKILGHDGLTPILPSWGLDEDDPTDDVNDWEFSITNWSGLASTIGLADENPGHFRVGAFMGAIPDNVGEDFIYYHQFPSTMVTITPSSTVVIGGETVSLVVMEENDSEAVRGQFSGPLGNTNDVPHGFSSVQVVVEQGSINPPSSFVELSWSPLGPPPYDGDDGNNVLDSPVPEKGIPGETWIWGTDTPLLMSNTITEDSNDFRARGSGIDPIGFIHTFEEDPLEEDIVTVDVVELSTMVTIVPSATMVPMGVPVDLKITETNDGQEDLTDVMVVVTQDGVELPWSPLVAPPDSGDDGDGVLEPTETWVWTRSSAPIMVDPTEFVAIGSGVCTSITPNLTITWCENTDDPPENTICDQDERAIATVGIPELSTMVTIEPSTTDVPSGDTVVMTITETNDGGDPLTDVEVIVKQDGVELPWSPLVAPPDGGDDGDGILEFGESWVWYRPSAPIINNPTQVVATGKGTYNDGINPPIPVVWCPPGEIPPIGGICDENEQAIATYYPFLPSTVIDIKANGDNGPITIGVGDPVTLTICEENDSFGDVPLTNVGVEVYYDDGSGETYLTTLLPPPDSGDDGDNVLEPGEKWCWDYVVPSVSVDTTFIAYGYGEYITSESTIIITWCQGEPPQEPGIIIVCDESERDDVDVITESFGCRLTGGGNDEEYSEDGVSAQNNGGDRARFGGQAGANTALPPQPKGEWTHHQQRGPSGSFTFHGGTASSPAGSEIIEIRCSDPGTCKPSGDPPSPAKQLDFDGIGTFKNFGKAGTAREPQWLIPGAIAECSSAGGKWRFDGTFHYFQVNADDCGEPGNQIKSMANTGKCPPNGFGEKGDLPLAECDCPDFYRITIYNGVKAADVEWLDENNINLNSLNTTDVIYEFHGYIDGGNLQIHRLTGYDLNQASGDSVNLNLLAANWLEDV